MRQRIRKRTQSTKSCPADFRLCVRLYLVINSDAWRCSVSVTGKRVYGFCLAGVFARSPRNSTAFDVCLHCKTYFRIFLHNVALSDACFAKLRHVLRAHSHAVHRWVESWEVVEARRWVGRRGCAGVWYIFVCVCVCADRGELWKTTWPTWKRLCDREGGARIDVCVNVYVVMKTAWLQSSHPSDARRALNLAALTVWPRFHSK